MKKSIAGVFASSVLFVNVALEAEAQTYNDVSDSHWANDEISYISEEEIITGYSDGSFRPSVSISRSQTAVMLSRALDLDDAQDTTEFNDVSESHQNYEAIQQVNEAGIMTGGSNGDFRPSESLTRSQMSAVLTRAFELEADRPVEFRDLNHTHWAYDEIAPVVTNYISTGKNDGTYAPTEHVSRAHFSIFMARALSEDFRPETTNETLYGDDWSFRGIELGDTVERVERFNGEPEVELPSRYGFMWHVYHDEFDNYVQYGVENGVVVAALTPQSVWRGEEGIERGSTKSEVRSHYGSPMTTLIKDNVRYNITSEHKDMFELDDRYVTFYYDGHNEEEVSSIFAIDQSVEDRYEQYYPDSTGLVRDTLETQTVLLTNAVRVANDLGVLEQHDASASTALDHSRDMARNNYFSHYDPDGIGPFNRMESDGIEFRSAAENLARGHIGPLDAVEGWLNSTAGHREALLGNYTHTGVGIAFDEERNNRPYYTQLYFTKP